MALILAVIALLSFTVLNTEYLFKWAAHNWKFYLLLSTIALLLFFLDKRFVSAFMSTGISVGIFVGNFLGRAMKRLNERKIVEGMKAEEIYRLQHHPGFEIWIGTILLFIVIGIAMQNAVTKKSKN